jgi:flagellar basal-body rod protein FlgF
LINGIYLATSGMNVEQKRMDVLANNLANINTNGYKKEKVSFQVYRNRYISNLSDKNRLGDISGGTIIGQRHIDLSEGNIKFTGNYLDFTVNGKNFFVVNGPNGQLLTKDGSFNIDENGFLINKDGYFVEGTNGKIQIVDNGVISADETGNIYVEDKNIGAFKVLSASDEKALTTAGNSYFILNENAAAVENMAVSIKQGYVESSNVNGIAEMADMISVTRAYEANQKIISMQDEILKKTTNEVGKI